MGLTAFGVVSPEHSAPLDRVQGAGPAASDKHGPRTPATDRKRDRPPKPLRFTCADALDDGTLIDSRQGNQLAASASVLGWKEGYGLPTPCHRVVRLFCGPEVGDRSLACSSCCGRP